MAARCSVLSASVSNLTRVIDESFIARVKGHAPGAERRRAGHLARLFAGPHGALQSHRARGIAIRIFEMNRGVFEVLHLEGAPSRIELFGRNLEALCIRRASRRRNTGRCRTRQNEPTETMS